MRGKRHTFRLGFLLVLAALSLAIAIFSSQAVFSQQAIPLSERNVTVTFISPAIQAARAATSTTDGYAVADTSDTPDSQLLGNVFRGDRAITAQAGDGFLSTTQALLGNKAYLIFTTGQRANFMSRLPLLKDGSFENFINPSFAHPLETDSRINLELSYQNIIVNGSETLPSGTYSLLIRNVGLSQNKVVVNVARR